MANPSPPVEPDRPTLLAKYHKGMAGLGAGLLVIAVLQTGVAALLARAEGQSPFLVLIGGMAAFHFVTGVLLLGKRGWVNYLVLVWAVALVVGNLILMNLKADGGNAGVNLPRLAGLIVPALLLYSSANNIGLRRKLRAGPKPA